MADGYLLQRVDFLLPVNERETDFMAIEPSTRPINAPLLQEFDAAVVLTKALLKRLCGEAQAPPPQQTGPEAHNTRL